jgi:hypothetical protein
MQREILTEPRGLLRKILHLPPKTRTRITFDTIDEFRRSKRDKTELYQLNNVTIARKTPTPPNKMGRNFIYFILSDITGDLHLKAYPGDQYAGENYSRILASREGDSISVLFEENDHPLHEDRGSVHILLDLANNNLCDISPEYSRTDG